MKLLIDKLAKKMIYLMWPQYMNTGGVIHSYSVMLRCFFIQKICRINAHVPWPVHPTSKILSPHKIKRGTRTPGLGVCCHIDGRNGIELGDNVWIGPRVSIISMDHDVTDFEKYVKSEPVIIGKNSWLAANCVVLPGVVLGEHTVVAAGAVVASSFPESDQILAGVPAKVVKKIESYSPDSMKLK